MFYFSQKIYEPQRNKMTCVASEDSDQPGHSPSLTGHRCPPEESMGP